MTTPVQLPPDFATGLAAYIEVTRTALSAIDLDITILETRQSGRLPAIHGIHVVLLIPIHDRDELSVSGKQGPSHAFGRNGSRQAPIQILGPRARRGGQGHQQEHTQDEQDPRPGASRPLAG